ncbi:DUF6101 family protein [Pseudoxanthobacter sp. M-2]|uniref:DUF6101 family protein n=1 Tax=Pseudoxanthobacter sp. M-2 TaxID=3078754 RepID=UPI0038FC5298
MPPSTADINTADRAPRAADDLLPHRFAAEEGVVGNDALLSLVLDETHAVIRRRLSGVAMTMVIPVAAFRGVGVCISDDLDEISFLLVHSDPGLTVPLGATDTVDEAARLLDGWSKALRLPRLFVDRDGIAAPIDAVIATAAPDAAPRPLVRAGGPSLRVHEGGRAGFKR